MALEIFKLVGSIFVDNEKANESIAKTDKKAESLGSKMIKGVGAAAKWGAGIVTAAAGAVTAVGGVALSVADTAGSIDDAAKKVGTSAEEYQKWAYAANLGGMEASKLEALMVKQQKAFSDAKDGSKAMSEAYERLGVDIKNIGNSGDAFNEVISALADMEDETTRNALANDIFGKSYADLAPLLAEGSAGIKAMKQEAADLGGIMSDEAIEAGAQLGDSIDKLKTSGQGILNMIATSAMPMITKFIDLILSNMPMVQGMMEILVPIILQLLETALPMLENIMQALLPPLINIVQVLLPPLLGLLTPILDLLSPILKLLQPILDLIVAVLEPLGSLITKLLTPLVEVIGKLIEIALEPLQEQFSILSGIISGIVCTAFDTVMSQVDMVKGIFTGLINFISGIFTGDWEKAWGGVVNIFTSIFEGISNAAKIPMNYIIDGINAFIRGINHIKIPDWVPAVGGKGFNIDELPHLEEGTVLEKGQTGFLEGNGAEAVVPLHNNKKWIASIAREMQAQGIGGRYDREILEMLKKIYNRLDELSITEIIHIVPDNRRLFEIIREESEKNADRGGEPITV